MTQMHEFLTQAIYSEMLDAQAKHGCYFNSDHEASAVIREEVEEFNFEVKNVKDCFKDYWDAVKSDDADDILTCIKTLESSVKLALCELVQVAAMCAKAIRTIEQEDED